MSRFDRVMDFFVRPDLFSQFPTRISKFLNSLNFELLTVYIYMIPTIIYKFSWDKKKLDKNNPLGVFYSGGEYTPSVAPDILICCGYKKYINFICNKWVNFEVFSTNLKSFVCWLHPLNFIQVSS